MVTDILLFIGQVILSPLDSVADTYRALLPEGTTSEFQRILELKVTPCFVSFLGWVLFFLDYFIFIFFLKKILIIYFWFYLFIYYFKPFVCACMSGFPGGICYLHEFVIYSCFYVFQTFPWPTKLCHHEFRDPIYTPFVKSVAVDAGMVISKW